MQELIARVRKVIDLVSSGGTLSLDMLEEVGLIITQIAALLKSWQTPDSPSGPSIFGSTHPVETWDLESCVSQLENLSEPDSSQAFGANPIINALLMRLAELLIDELKEKLFSR